MQKCDRIVLLCAACSDFLLLLLVPNRYAPLPSVVTVVLWTLMYVCCTTVDLCVDQHVMKFVGVELCSGCVQVRSRPAFAVLQQ